MLSLFFVNQAVRWRPASQTMPIYEYRCASCGHKLESLQKFSDPPLVECPHCHRPDLKKLVSAVGFQLKGSGWYVTDFRDHGTKPAAKSGEREADGHNGAHKHHAAADGAGGGASEGGNHAAATGKSESSETSPGGQATGESTSARSGETSGAAAPAGSTSSDSASGSTH